MECAKVPSGVRKVKKNQVKDELDRIKQAEKKKRRLEKALATSAAIRSELEKKKQKKKEEQQRLDEEGAAIAEAVALHVLLGEDSDESCNAMVKEEDGFGPWECTNKLDLFMQGRKGALPHNHLPSHSLEGTGWFSDAYGYGCDWNDWSNSGWTVPSRPFGRDIQTPYFDGRWETPGISAELIAAQAVSALQIAEDAPVDTLIFNEVFRE